MPAKNRVQAKDMVFHLSQCGDTPKQTWTAFNKQHSDRNPQCSSVGYLPIIQAHAHDIYTLNTIVQRLIHNTCALKQTHVVLTVSQSNGAEVVCFRIQGHTDSSSLWTAYIHELFEDIMTAYDGLRTG